jgi:ATP-dependent DNA ligase
MSFTSMGTRPVPSRTRSAWRCSRSWPLDGPAWRTPASVVLEPSEGFVARVEDLGLEGVVAKRLSSTYVPGRRRTAWVKHKLRRNECLLVTGIRRTREGTTEAVFVARRQSNGRVATAGSIELGIGGDLIDQLENHVAGLPVRRHGTVLWYPAEVSLVASVRGLPGRPVRDAILRQIVNA